MTFDIRFPFLGFAVALVAWGAPAPSRATGSPIGAATEVRAPATPTAVAVDTARASVPADEPPADESIFHTPDYTLFGLSAQVGDPDGDALDPDFSLVDLMEAVSDFDPAEPLARNARRPFERVDVPRPQRVESDGSVASPGPTRVAVGLDPSYPSIGGMPLPKVDTRRQRHPGHAEVASSVEQTISIPDSATVVTSRLDTVRQEQADGMPGMRILKPGMRVRHAVAEGVEFNGQVAADHFESRAADSLTRLRYDTGLTLRPSGTVRVDLGANQAGYDDLGAMRRGITAHYANLAVAVTPSPQLRSTLRVNRGFYSDGNLRDLAQFEAERHALASPNLWVGTRMSYLDYARSTAAGFYNPQRVGSAMATLRVESEPGAFGSRFRYGASAAFGRELVGPAGERAIYDLTVQAAWRVARGTSIEARVQTLSPRAGLAGNAGSTVVGATFRQDL